MRISHAANWGQSLVLGIAFFTLFLPTLSAQIQKPAPAPVWLLDAGLARDQATLPLRHVLDVVDLDGDGRHEVIQRDSQWRVSVQTFRDGRFHEVPLQSLQSLQSPLSVMSYMATGDLDGDGDLDILLLSIEPTLQLRRRILWYENIGLTSTRPWPLRDSFPEDIAPTFASAFDFNGDGQDEVFFFDERKGNGLWRLEGDVFVEITPAQFSSLRITGPTLCLDVDGDGDLDFLALSERRLWRNDRTGFTEIHLPMTLGAGDLDGDGLIDLVGNVQATGLVIYQGSPLGFLPPTVVAAGVQPSLLRLVDVDQDGDLDLFGIVNQGVAVYWQNDGGLRFTRQPAPFPLPASRSSTAPWLADLDGDSDLDAIVQHGTYSTGLGQVVWNDGGQWSADRGYLQFTDREPVAVGDLDGDGAPEIVLQDGTVLRNDGTGRFPSHVRLPEWLELGAMGAIADMDNDGLNDLVVANRRAVYLYRGQGQGMLQPRTELISWSVEPRSLHLVDVDGDGNLDVLHFSFSHEVLLLLGDGTGGFTRSTTTFPSIDSPVHAVVTDFDGDGDLDVITAPMLGDRIALLRNRGGTFVAEPFPGLPVAAITTTIYNMALGDFFGDGREDIAISYMENDRITVLRNLGRETYEVQHHAMTGSARSRLVAADLNLDGKDELVALDHHSSERSPRVYRVDGPFLEHVTSVYGLPEKAWGFHAVVADLDGDGDVDLSLQMALPGEPEGAARRTYTNQSLGLRRVTAGASRIGERTSFVITSKPDRAPRPQFALPILGTGVTAVSLPPLGTLRVDPVQAFMMPILLLPAPDGSVRFDVDLPGDRSLRGARLVLQALVVDLVAGGSFTNVVVERVR